MKNTFYYETLIGKITISDNQSHITDLHFGEIHLKDSNIRETKLIKEAYNQLKEYFNKERRKFELPLAPQGTEFQLKVWNALQEIPYGETCSYKQIAVKVGNEKACRAVGMANNRNPISIFIPCHRVIGANGNLIGYGGGLDIKEKLLNLEKENY
ncbi:MAG: methylated-DNA--[protein]-cysteine S-methyltransferase [Clostridium butyricum]|nr:methylated-DNA--[protein]-cysteine S-methyltransferase [Clostridium butyricum]